MVDLSQPTEIIKTLQGVDWEKFVDYPLETARIPDLDIFKMATPFLSQFIDYPLEVVGAGAELVWDIYADFYGRLFNNESVKRAFSEERFDEFTQDLTNLLAVPYRALIKYIGPEGRRERLEDMWEENQAIMEAAYRRSMDKPLDVFGYVLQRTRPDLYEQYAFRLRIGTTTYRLPITGMIRQSDPNFIQYPIKGEMTASTRPGADPILQSLFPDAFNPFRFPGYGKWVPPLYKPPSLEPVTEGDKKKDTRGLSIGGLAG